jgi:hypothetical protein
MVLAAKDKVKIRDSSLGSFNGPDWRTSILESLGRSALMRKILFLICVLGMPCTSYSQTNQASWANLSALHAGQKIQVVEINSKKHSGTFVNFSDTAISYKQTAGEQSVQKQDVRSVKLMENKHRLRNTLIGGAVGAGTGAGIGAAWHPNDGFFGTGTYVAVDAGIGFVGGVVVGVLWPSHNTIYRVNSH